MKILLRYLAFVLMIGSIYSSHAGISEDDGARRAVLDLRNRIKDINDKSVATICTKNSPSTFEGDERLGDIGLNQGDSTAREAIKDLRLRVIKLETLCEITSKKFLSVPSSFSFFGLILPTEDNELRKSIINLRGDIKILEEKIKNQVTQKMQSDEQINFGSENTRCKGTQTAQWNNCVGTLFYPNGAKHTGEFRYGEKFGRGIEYDHRGDVSRDGYWSDHRFFKDIDTFKISLSEQKTPPTNAELLRLQAEAEESKRKQAVLEEQLRLAQQQTTPEVSPFSPLTTMANRKALVIGNDSYKSVAKLLNAREDARTMASNLTSVGYQVTLKLDLSEKEMKAAMRTFASQVQGGDEVLFFFAGHGVQLGSTNYLLPTDIGGESEAQVRDESIQLQRILDDMSERKAKFTLAMIDACRDNPFKSSGRAIGGRGLAPTTAATGQMVIFSAGTGQQALDKLNNADKNKNGLFTRIFVQEMQKPSQSIDRVVKNVRNQVAELAKSVGHEQVPAIYDQVLGDFYFKK